MIVNQNQRENVSLPRVELLLISFTPVTAFWKVIILQVKFGFYFASAIGISCQLFALFRSNLELMTSAINNHSLYWVNDSNIQILYWISELNQELTSFKTETARVQEIKRKLQFEKDKLSRELREFENQRNEEYQKIDEERKKLKRDKLILDKANREAKYSLNCTNCKENKIRTQKIINDLNNKEKKWNAAINRLKEKLQQLEQEKNVLENENLELRHLAEQSDEEDDLPDSGFRSQQARFGTYIDIDF